MTPKAATVAIELAVNTAWANATPISWPNVPFTPPATGNWLKVDLIWGNGQVLTKGFAGGVDAVTGIVQLAVFGPKGKGDGPLLTLADTARAILNRKRFTGASADLMFGAVSGPVTLVEEAWRTIVLSCPFRVTETVA
jgi:hypothetical protein